LLEDPAPYHVGDVRMDPDTAEEPGKTEAIAARVRELFVRVGRAAQVLADESTSLPELPDNPGLLSFSIAGVIDLDAEARQRMLADRSPLARLEELEVLLGSAVEPLEHRAAVHARASTNGTGPGH